MGRKLGIWVKQKSEIYVFNYWLLFLWVILNNFNFILKILFAIVNNWFGLFATHSFTNSNFREYFCLTKSIEKYQRRFVSISKIHNWTKLIDTICENYPQVSYPILHSCYLLSSIIGPLHVFWVLVYLSHESSSREKIIVIKVHIFSEKATKLCEIFTLLLTGTT